MGNENYLKLMKFLAYTLTSSDYEAARQLATAAFRDVGIAIDSAGANTRVIRFYLFQVPPYARARLRFMALRHRASATSLTLLNRRMLRAKLRRMERIVGLLRTRLASSCMATSSM